MTQREMIPYNEQDNQTQRFIHSRYQQVENHLKSFLGKKDLERNPSFEVAIYYGAQLAALDAEINEIGHNAYWLGTPGHEDAQTAVDNELPQLLERQQTIITELIAVSRDNYQAYTIFDDATVARGYLMATRRQPLGGESALAVAGFAKDKILQYSNIEYLRRDYPTASCFQIDDDKFTFCRSFSNQDSTTPETIPIRKTVFLSRFRHHLSNLDKAN